MALKLPPHLDAAGVRFPLFWKRSRDEHMLTGTGPRDLIVLRCWGSLPHNYSQANPKYADLPPYRAAAWYNTEQWRVPPQFDTEQAAVDWMLKEAMGLIEALGVTVAKASP